MFSVIFEVLASSDHAESYLAIAGSLKPEVEQIVGFVDNIRYRSLTREGWRLSLSSWANEKALIRWRTMNKHHNAQDLGRKEIFEDYHLRVGQNTQDTHLPDGQDLLDQRLDVTETSQGTTVTILTTTIAPEQLQHTPAMKIARAAGIGSENLADPVTWDIFENVAQAGEFLLLCSWAHERAAANFEKVWASAPIWRNARHRRVRVIRDYGMFDRREAPQYFPDAVGEETRHV